MKKSHANMVILFHLFSIIHVYMISVSYVYVFVIVIYVVHSLIFQFGVEMAHWTGSDIYFHVVPPSGHMLVTASAATPVGGGVGEGGAVLLSCKGAPPGELCRKSRKRTVPE